MTTTIESKAQILSELWQDYREDNDFKDFIEYNDLGLPLAYAFANEIAKETELAERYVNESYDLLAESLGVSGTEPFDSLEDMLEQSVGE